MRPASVVVLPLPFLFLFRSAEPAGGGAARKARCLGDNASNRRSRNCYALYKHAGLAMVNVIIAKSGKVASAVVTGKFAGTPTGSCVESAVKSASFPPSDGLTTPYPFTLR